MGTQHHRLAAVSGLLLITSGASAEVPTISVTPATVTIACSAPAGQLLGEVAASQPVRKFTLGSVPDGDFVLQQTSPQRANISVGPHGVARADCGRQWVLTVTAK
jgi:hypothetical protein